MRRREAFQVFIRHQLEFAVEEGKIGLTDVEIEKFANAVEDDFDFYERLADFIVEEIEDFGENYGLQL